jgi:anti-sigma B factor antagonist
MIEISKIVKASSDIGIVSAGNEMDRSVAIEGRITVSNSGDIRAALTNALRTKPARVCVDLSNVSYLDTSGLATLIEAARRARNQGTRLLLSGLRDQPRYFFEITHLDRFFETTQAGSST